MSSYFSTRAFVVAVSISLAILWLGTFGFRYILFAAVHLSSCKGTPGTCGALAVAVGMFLKPALLLVSLAIYIYAVTRRLWRNLSLLWLLFPVLLVAANSQFFYGFGNFWGANFSRGILYVSGQHIPLLISILVFTVVLFAAGNRPASVQSFGVLGVKAAYGLPIGLAYTLSAIWLGILCAMIVLSEYERSLLVTDSFMRLFNLFNSRYLSAANVILGGVLATILYGTRGSRLPPSEVAKQTHSPGSAKAFGRRKP